MGGSEKANRILLTYLCCIIVTVFAMSSTIVGPLLTKFASEYSLGMAQSGIFFTVNFIGYFVFLLLNGFIAEAIGKKRIISICIVGFTISVLLFPFTRNIFTACIIMLLIGGFGGSLGGMLASTVSALNAGRESFYVNIYYAFYGIGALISPLIAVIILQNSLSWKVCYYIIGLFSLLLTIVFLGTKLPVEPKSGRISLVDVKMLITDKKFLLICLCLVFCTGSEVASWGWLSTFLKQDFGAKAGFTVSVFWIFMTVGRTLSGTFTLKYSERNIVLVLTASASAVTILFSFISNGYLIWIMIALMGLSYSGQYSTILSYGGKSFAKHSAVVFAILISSGALGNMIIPYAMGLIGENIGIRAAIISPVFLLLTVTAIFAGIGKRGGNQQHNGQGTSLWRA